MGPHKCFVMTKVFGKMPLLLNQNWERNTTQFVFIVSGNVLLPASYFRLKLTLVTISVTSSPNLFQLMQGSICDPQLCIKTLRNRQSILLEEPKYCGAIGQSDVICFCTTRGEWQIFGVVKKYEFSGPMEKYTKWHVCIFVLLILYLIAIFAYTHLCISVNRLFWSVTPM